MSNQEGFPPIPVPYTGWQDLLGQAISSAQRKEAQAREGQHQAAEQKFADLSSSMFDIMKLPDNQQVDATAKLMREGNFSSHAISQVTGLPKNEIENVLAANNYGLRGQQLEDDPNILVATTDDPNDLTTPTTLSPIDPDALSAAQADAQAAAQAAASNNNNIGGTPANVETPESIMAEYKDRDNPVTDILTTHKQENGEDFPVDFLLEILRGYASRGNEDAKTILGKWNDKIAKNQDTAANTGVDAVDKPQGVGDPTGGAGANTGANTGTNTVDDPVVGGNGTTVGGDGRRTPPSSTKTPFPLSVPPTDTNPPVTDIVTTDIFNPVVPTLSPKEVQPSTSNPFTLVQIANQPANTIVAPARERSPVITTDINFSEVTPSDVERLFRPQHNATQYLLAETSQREPPIGIKYNHPPGQAQKYLFDMMLDNSDTMIG